ncbi:hypothetical protein QVD17_09085 [Tagetes erecta]|uniref:Uncharacterized protein n=1 Tax=Tagetes erecta TaxID=13708 RepID=A0AAD8L5B2_TARER|nr:hypothetical protein QVD17_09085 [Tagetes erecta]
MLLFFQIDSKMKCHMRGYFMNAEEADLDTLPDLAPNLEPIIISDDDTCADDMCTPVGHSIKMKPKNSCGPSTYDDAVDVSYSNVYSFRKNLQNHFVGSPVKVSFEGNGAVQHRVVTEKNGSYKRHVIDNWRDFLMHYGLAQGVYCQFVWLRETNVLEVSRV